MVNSSEILNSSILIVDDQEADVRLLERMLFGVGYTCVSTTMHPQQVCELHRNHRYDLILLDLEMPGMDGFQVMEDLKAIETDSYLPVLVITAHAKHKLLALAAGAKDFVTKPFDLDEVQTRIHNMLEVRLLHKQLHNYNNALGLRVQEKTADLKESYLETIFTMMRAAEYRDDDTGAHVQRISYYCREFALMLGLDEAFVDHIFSPARCTT